MNSKYQIIALCLVTVAVLGGTYFVGTQSSNRDRQAAPATVRDDGLETFVSKKMSISFSYPKGSLGQIHDANPIHIPDNTSEFTSYLISTESTKYVSIHDWLAAQPKGDSAHAGLKPLLWVESDRLIAEEYGVVDHDGQKPIYGKHLVAFILDGNRLVEVKLAGQTAADEVDITETIALTLISTMKIEL